ncbi:hypothetical protein ACWD4T_12360, partial [Streptomyces umbrinus]
VSTAETLLFTTVTAAIFLTVLASVAGMILACPLLSPTSPQPNVPSLRPLLSRPSPAPPP